MRNLKMCLVSVVIAVFIVLTAMLLNFKGADAHESDTTVRMGQISEIPDEEVVLPE